MALQPVAAPTSASIDGTPVLADLLMLTPPTLKKAITMAMAAKVPVFVWGEPGVAKSSVVKQIATKIGIAFIDFRLGSKQPNDIRGLPFPVTEGGVSGVKWAPALLLPRDLDIDVVIDLDAAPRLVKFHNPRGRNHIHYVREIEIEAVPIDPSLQAVVTDQTPTSVRFALVDKSGEFVSGKLHYTIKGKAHAIVALDEFNSATKSVQGATYSLILDGQIDDYTVPDGVYLIAMGNNDTDGGVTYPLAKPIENRFTHLYTKMDYTSWAAHAFANKYNPIVQGFYETFPTKLHVFDAKSPERAFSTARTAEYLSRLMDANSYEDMTSTVGRSLVCGTVGKAIGLEFMTYLEVASKMVNPAEILRGNITKFDYRDDISLCSVMGASLLYLLQSEAEKLDVIDKRNPSQQYLKWMQRADNFYGFMEANFKPMMSISLTREAISNFNLPLSHSKMTNYGAFFAKFKADILGRSTS